MSEAEGGWADLLHESALEVSSSQTTAKPVSVPEHVVTVPETPRYACSPQKGSKVFLTVGVKKKKIIPLCHVAHELTSRTYGEKKWWVVIVKDQ